MFVEKVSTLHTLLNAIIILFLVKKLCSGVDRISFQEASKTFYLSENNFHFIMKGILKKYNLVKQTKNTI